MIRDAVLTCMRKLTQVSLIYCTEPTTHTHTFKGPLSGTTWVSRYQKGKTNLDFTEARDSEWQWHQLGHMQVCTSLQIDNHASTPPLSFLQAGCPSCRPNNSVKALKARNQQRKSGKTEKLKIKKRVCSEVSVNSLGNPWSQSWNVNSDRSETMKIHQRGFCNGSKIAVFHDKARKYR